LDASFHTMAARLREQRKKERAYLDNSLDAIGAFDNDYQLTTLNPAAESLWALDIEILLGTSVLNLISENERSAFQEVLASLKTSEAQPMCEIETQMSSPADMHMLWSISWSSTEQCFFFVAHDITKRKELERMKKEFIAVVSHDLRSPLGTIYGTTELMLHGVFGEIEPSSRLLLDEVNVQVNEMLELINDLLDLEKLNAGQMHLTHTRVKLSELMDKTVLLVDTVLTQKEQTLNLSSVQCELSVDVERMSQALANLVLEMSALVAEGTSLQMQMSTGLTNELQLAITAQTKISKETMRLVQGRLANLHNSGQGRTSGSRLRLPLAKTIIESHGGTIQATKTRTKQPLFYITLPLSENSVSDEQEPAGLIEATTIRQPT
jgi:PAS domain S-box-containing protein